MSRTLDTHFDWQGRVSARMINRKLKKNKKKQRQFRFSKYEKICQMELLVIVVTCFDHYLTENTQCGLTYIGAKWHDSDMKQI